MGNQSIFAYFISLFIFSFGGGWWLVCLPHPSRIGGLIPISNGWMDVWLCHVMGGTLSRMSLGLCPKSPGIGSRFSLTLSRISTTKSGQMDGLLVQKALITSILLHFRDRFASLDIQTFRFLYLQPRLHTKMGKGARWMWKEPKCICLIRFKFTLIKHTKISRSASLI